jgi:serine/threonine protein kinase
LSYTDVFRHGNFFGIVTPPQAIHGLFHLLQDRKGDLPEAYIAEVAHSLVAGLIDVHGASWVHGDVKTENVFLSESEFWGPGLPFAMLGDFDHARPMTAGRVSCADSLGTPNYLAPERLDGDAFDDKADRWGLGLIMLEVANGKSAFSLKDGFLNAHIREGAYTPLGEQWSIEFNEFVEWLLEPDPGVRPTAADAITHRFIGSRLRKKAEWQAMQKTAADEDMFAGPGASGN